MGLIWTIIIGFIVGLLAKMLTPGRDPGGFFITAIIGIVGSLLATYGGQALGLYNPGERRHYPARDLSSRASQHDHHHVDIAFAAVTGRPAHSPARAFCLGSI